MRPLSAVLALLLAIAPALAQEATTLGPLAPFATPGVDGPWRASAPQGRFVLENTTAAGAIRYLRVEAEHPLQMSVRVTVAAEPSGTTANGAGLLYALQGEGADRLYYLVLLEAGGKVSLFRRDQAGFNRLISTQRDGLATDRPVQLGLRESGNGFEYTLDGERIGSLEGRGTGKGAVGIAAAGQGKFVFEDFRLGKPDRASLSTPAPQQPAVAAERPRRSPPPGFAAALPPGGSGQVFVAKASGGGSAKTALREAIQAFASYFDTSPRITAAITDRQDREAQASFVARHEGRAVAGLFLVADDGRSRAVTIVCDAPERIAQSVAGLMRSAEPLTPAPPAVARPSPWHNVQLADGGFMRLPDGWSVARSIKGMVDVTGPDRAWASFGISTPILDPSDPHAHIAQGDRSMRIAPYSDPVRAVVNLFGAPVQILESWPVAMPEFPQGQAAFIHFRFSNPQDGQPSRALALVITAPGRPFWQYYVSQVTAPEAVFPQRLPEMMEIWRSWRVSDRVLQERLQAVASNMREIGRIMASSSQHRERVMEKVHAGWIEYIQGTRYELDTRFGELRPQSLHDIGKIVEKKNELEGYKRYEEVPLDQLVRW